MPSGEILETLSQSDVPSDDTELFSYGCSECDAQLKFQ